MLTPDQIRKTLMAAALVCAAVTIHDIALHLTYGGRASAWRPTRPLPVAPAQAAPIQR
jgi:hypothetical protein